MPGQNMGYPLSEPLKNVNFLSEFELQQVPVDNARMEKLESVVYELLNIINILIGSVNR